MATIYKCDRCGKILYNRPAVNRIIMEREDGYHKSTEISAVDLCDECKKGYLRWIKHVGEDVEKMPDYKETMVVNLRTSADTEKYKAGYNEGYNAALDDIMEGNENDNLS